MDLMELLREIVALDASDLYLVVGAVPSANKDGRLMPLRAAGGKRLDPDMAERFARSMMSEANWKQLLEEKECNLAYMREGVGRFRVNVYWQRGSIGMVLRRVKMEIPTLRQLKLPRILRDISLEDRGIILVTGATGSGKSSTMASMIDYRNHLRRGHIVTIEDPIEFLYKHDRSIVTQRELGIDTYSFHEALKNSLRQAPQVIVLGELRDAETVQFSLHAAETGHLVFATLHSTNSTITIERILNFFPAEMEGQLLMQIAMNLRAIISQRLVPRIDGGRIVACEILVNTPTIQAFIKKNQQYEIRTTLDQDNQDGITSVDKSLFKLVKRNIISPEEALAAAESANDLLLKLRGIGIPPGSGWMDWADEWEGIHGDFELPGTDTARRFAAEASMDPMGSDALPHAPKSAIPAPPSANWARLATPVAPERETAPGIRAGGGGGAGMLMAGGGGAPGLPASATGGGAGFLGPGGGSTGQGAGAAGTGFGSRPPWPGGAGGGIGSLGATGAGGTGGLSGFAGTGLGPGPGLGLGPGPIGPPEATMHAPTAPGQPQKAEEKRYYKIFDSPSSGSNSSPSKSNSTSDPDLDIDRH